jgi:predicted component of type VI protein secretion system
MKKDKKSGNKDIDNMMVLRDIVSEHLSHWEFEDMLEKSMICLNYVEQYGVKDIQGFIQFCKDKDMENKITPTIAHDLNGTFDRCFLPRTTDYGKYTKKGQ